MTGIELIAKERQEQLEKHGISVKNDAQFNSMMEDNGLPALTLGAVGLFDNSISTPVHWDARIIEKMRCKPYKERLIIAGALLAAEIDRVQYLEDQRNSK
jgi:hypothetical protein